MGPAIAGDFAAQPHVTVSVLHRLAQRKGELGDGVLGEIGLRGLWTTAGHFVISFAWRALSC